MTIRAKLTKKDFIKINLTILYQKTATKVVLGVALLLLAGNVYVSVFWPAGDKPFITGYIVFAAIVIYLPAVVIYAVSKNYSSNKRLSEMIEYQFTQDYLLVKGDSFSVQSSWDKVYKVTQTKDWILIWQSKAGANAIPKKDISEEGFAELKEILENHKVKNTL